MEERLHPAQIAAYRKMTAVQKLAVAESLYLAARELKAQAVKLQHPTWTEAQVEARVREIFLLASS